MSVIENSFAAYKLRFGSRVSSWHLWATSAVVQYACLSLCYPEVSSYFEYMKFSIGYRLLMFHPIFLLLSFLFGLTAVAPFARLNLIITTIPTFVLFAFEVVSPELVILCIAFQAYINAIDKNIGFPFLRSSNINSVKVILLLSAGFSLVGLVYFRDLISFSNLLDVYGNRQLYADKVSQGSHIIGYFKLVVKIFLIILALLAYKNYRYGVLAILFSIVFYTILSSKFILAIPLLVWIIPFILRSPKSIIFIFSFVLFLNYASLYTDYHLTIVSLTRRAFLLTARLNDMYHSIYIDLGPQYFTTSFLAFFSEQESVPISRMASVYMWGSERVNANSGLFGSSIAQLGYIGPFVYSTIYIFLINLNKGYRESDTVSISVVAIFMLIAVGVSDISTTLVLHGGIIMCVLMRFNRKTLGLR